MSFTPDIYEVARQGSQNGATVLVPILCDWFAPRTVIDAGCGEGWFGRAFADRGRQVVGLDSAIEQASEETFANGGNLRLAQHDLTQDAPLGQADLTLCLEVGEHLPEDAAAVLVKSLCASAPIVVFSGALPGQGGHLHVNEQWPTYWADLFAVYDYVFSDDLRWLIWENEGLAPWYRNNIFVIGERETLDGAGRSWRDRPLNVVHPDIHR